MPSLVSRSSMTAALSEAIHVEIYDEDGELLDPLTAPADWSDLADTTDVTTDDTGYLFTSTVVGFDVVTATIGDAVGSFTLRWVAGKLRFSAETAPAPES